MSKTGAADAYPNWVLAVQSYVLENEKSPLEHQLDNTARLKRETDPNFTTLEKYAFRIAQ